MSDLDDLLTLGVIALAWKALSDWQMNVVPVLEQKGAQLYETLHPAEKGHASDLPGHQMTKAAIIALAAKVGFPDPNMAAAIALAESGGVPNAKADFLNGRPRSIGLWQINTFAWPAYSAEQMADPLKNAKAAFTISRGGTDWHHWSTWWKDASRKIGPGEGRYRMFL